MEASNRNPSDLADVIETAQVSVGVQIAKAPTPDQAAIVVVPEGARAEVLDLDHLERLRERPRRTTGVVALRNLASLAAYAHEHRTDETTLWVDEASKQIVAVLNDHTTSAAGWGDHRAILQLVHTEEWLRWVSRDGSLMPQEEFAQLIEEGQLDIVDPESAVVLELAQSFYVSSSASFRSKVDVQSGTVKFKFDEDANATAGIDVDGRRGGLEIPRSFWLGLAPFPGEPAYKIEALFKWRLKGKELQLGYKLVRPEATLRDAVEAIARRLSDGFEVHGGEVEGFGHVYMGAPRS